MAGERQGASRRLNDVRRSRKAAGGPAITHLSQPLGYDGGIRLPKPTARDFALTAILGLAAVNALLFGVACFPPLAVSAAALAGAAILAPFRCKTIGAIIGLVGLALLMAYLLAYDGHGPHPVEQNVAKHP